MNARHKAKCNAAKDLRRKKRKKKKNKRREPITTKEQQQHTEIKSLEQIILPLLRF